MPMTAALKMEVGEEEPAVELDGMVTFARDMAVMKGGVHPITFRHSFLALLHRLCQSSHFLC